MLNAQIQTLQHTIEQQRAAFEEQIAAVHADKSALHVQVQEAFVRVSAENEVLKRELKEQREELRKITTAIQSQSELVRAILLRCSFIASWLVPRYTRNTLMLSTPTNRRHSIETWRAQIFTSLQRSESCSCRFSDCKAI